MSLPPALPKEEGISTAIATKSVTVVAPPPASPSVSSTSDEKVDLADADEEKIDPHRHSNLKHEAASSIEVPDHPWRVKGPAIALALLLTLGSNYATSIIPPLKSTLKKEFAINNAQYAVLDTADSLINTILPVISGVAIDYYGPMSCGVWASSMIFLGALLTAVATSIRSYPLMVAAQIIKGFGNTTIETVQSKLYAWYSVGMTGFIFAVDISIGRVYNLAGKLSAVPVMEETGSWTWPFWVSAILCGATLAFNVAFFFYERTFSHEARVPTGRRLAMEDAARDGVKAVSFKKRAKTEFSYFSASIVAIPAAFWLIDISQLFQAGAVQTYTGNLADAISVTRDASTAAAGYTSAIGQVIPIVLTPCLGHVFDRWGRRMHWVTATASLYVVVFSLLAFTRVNALVPSILGSLALATNVLPWIVSVPLLVPDQTHLGTAFGIYKALTNCGTVVVSVVSGAIQDASGTGKNQYSNTFAFIICIKGLDIIYGLLYHQFDKRYLGGVLYMNDMDRRKKEIRMSEEERYRGLKSPIKVVTRGALFVVISMIVIAWVLYFYYSV